LLELDQRSAVSLTNGVMFKTQDLSDLNVRKSFDMSHEENLGIGLVKFIHGLGDQTAAFLLSQAKTG
jgi:hypothetical protein